MSDKDKSTKQAEQAVEILKPVIEELEAGIERALVRLNELLGRPTEDPRK